MQKKDFFLCGFTGWCLEILWTGLHSLVTGHFYYDGQNLSSDVPCLRTCSTDPSGLLQACPLSGYGTGGSFTAAGFFFVEFLSGSFFQKLHICPWDYSHVPLQYKGVIRLDYAPLWFFTGLFFEWLLRQNPRKVS